MLSSLFRKLSGADTFADPAPAEPLCVIGDVHGCLPLLERLLAQLPQDHRVILVGDYIDRGEHSAEVLRYLSTQPALTCLMGNHEEMLLAFLRHPEEAGGRWVRNGGLQTLASFGIRGVRPQMSADELRTCRDRLEQAMGDALIAWLAGLRRSVLSGTVLVTHAGADPQMPPDAQPEQVLTWGHQDFLRKSRRDGIWVVHGHTIVSRAAAVRGRIAVDTGAYATGRLSAACLAGGPARFLSTHI